MPKRRTTLILNDDVFGAVKIKAARTGKCDSQVIEESLRRDFGLDDLAEIWAEVSPAAEAVGMTLATDELRAIREERRGEGGT
jgi:gamma-glutamyl:cysteine ligase YbdK (ATP-grasp superfamily)